MKWMGKPVAVWAVFVRSFREQLTAALGYEPAAARAITKQAKARYRAIIADLPAFEKGDRFQMNIVGCAMLAAFVLSMPRRPGVDQLTDYYAAAMMTPLMKKLCRMSDAGGAPRFVRDYTLASGGPYCDCGHKKK